MADCTNSRSTFVPTFNFISPTKNSHLFPLQATHDRVANDQRGESRQIPPDMPPKRTIDHVDTGESDRLSSRAKRQALGPPAPAASSLPGRHASATDIISTLSDELLVRILSHLSLPNLFDLATVSRRFHRLSSDSQLWRAHYYLRFVLPRAMRIPGFRAADDGARMRFSTQRVLRADTAWGRGHHSDADRSGTVTPGSGGSRRRAAAADGIDWKRRYKIRHNWARGKCAVEEVSVGDAAAAGEDGTGRMGGKTLVKIAEGVAVTVDASAGLRAWDLKTRRMLAQADLFEGDGEGRQPAPSALALDDRRLPSDILDICVGFMDGSYSIWTCDVSMKSFVRAYKHESSLGGRLIGVAFSYPYVLTATDAVSISLYSFEQHGSRPSTTETRDSRMGLHDYFTETEDDDDESSTECDRLHNSIGQLEQDTKLIEDSLFAKPRLLTTLKSHTSRAPIALSIRTSGTSVIASVAYTFSTRQGWSIGVQDLILQHKTRRSKGGTESWTTRIAHTLPMTTTSHAPDTSPQRSPRPVSSPERLSGHLTTPTTQDDANGPTSLCYSHPYLLATLPDNTLILYLCTSDASSLSMSPGIRLWGHTSGVSDAEITPRGRAVSVSQRGDELRVWELEGRVGGKSVEIRPHDSEARDPAAAEEGVPAGGLDRHRNWVGFDDEMIIVLEEKAGRQALMVYDFT